MASGWFVRDGDGLSLWVTHLALWLLLVVKSGGCSSLRRWPAVREFFLLTCVTYACACKRVWMCDGSVVLCVWG